MFKRLLIAVITLSLLQGCGEPEQPQSPEVIALTLFEAIYIDNDADAAIALVDDRIAAQFRHYQLPSQIQRNVFGLSMQQVSVSIADVEVDFFRRNTESIKVLVRLDGQQGLNTVSDDRLVELQKRNNKWVITKVYDDPFGGRG